MIRIVNKPIKIYFFCLLCLAFVLNGCSKEDIKPSVATLDINNFIWDNMNQNYLWYDQMPQDIDLTKEIDPKGYFDQLLYKTLDRWSFITDDYQGLQDLLKGVRKSVGLHYQLYLVPGSTQLIGVVQYVVPESPAATAHIHRGDIIYKVDDIIITSSNYQTLLRNTDQLKLSIGHYDNTGQLIPDTDKTLQSMVLTENPIRLSKTIEYADTKIGYLCYNQFISDYNDSLDAAITRFKNDGISALVLDLRYNPGGSISNAIHLSSLIAPASVVNNQELFSTLIWNDKNNAAILAKEGAESENLIARFEIPNVNLDLHKIYILVSSSTASASELVINCLNPYMDVILIGQDHTTGKYVGSVTIYDKDKSHGWALQPIVLKTANAAGVTDYVNGFAPDYSIDDDLQAPLGSLDENMLAKAVELITGMSIGGPARTESQMLINRLSPLNAPELPWQTMMYWDK